MSPGQKRCYIMRDQLTKIIEILRNEKEIDVQFEGSLRKFELKRIVDKENNEIDINEFIQKYNIVKELIRLLNEITNSMKEMDKKEKGKEREKEKEKEKPRRKRSITTNGKVKESIENLSETSQKSLMKMKLNISLLNYLLLECTDYSFISSAKTGSNVFLFIDKIMKGNEIVYEKDKLIEELDYYSDAHKKTFAKKNQMQKLVELFQNETGILITFDNKINNWGIQSITSQDENNQFTIESFIEKYYKPNELSMYLSKSKSIPKEIIFDQFHQLKQHEHH